MLSLLLREIEFAARNFGSPSGKPGAMGPQLLSKITCLIGDKNMFNKVPIDCALPETKKIPENSSIHEESVIIACKKLST
jgi:hypothetical protein